MKRKKERDVWKSSVKMSRLGKASLGRIGDRMREGYTCQGYQSDVDSVRDCSSCGNSFCTSCLSKCSRCKSSFCMTCRSANLAKCSSCSNEYCHSFGQETCPTCRLSHYSCCLRGCPVMSEDVAYTLYPWRLQTFLLQKVQMQQLLFQSHVFVHFLQQIVL